MGITELFDMGFFSAFWNWTNPILTALIYAFVFAGAMIQLVLHKKCRKKYIKWSFIGGCFILMLISECLHQVIVGWDRLAVDFLYGFSVCLLLGAIVTAAIFILKKPKSM